MHYETNTQTTSPSDVFTSLVPKYKMILSDMHNSETPFAILPTDGLVITEEVCALIGEWNKTNHEFASLIPYNGTIFAILNGHDVSPYNQLLDSIRETVNFEELNVQIR